GLPVLPFLEDDEDLLGPLARRREVVVGDVHTAVAEAVQVIELTGDLRVRLVALLAPEVGDDVAELALERTAARDLDDAGDDAVVLVQMPVRQRTERQIRSGADV